MANKLKLFPFSVYQDENTMFNNRKVLWVFFYVSYDNTNLFVFLLRTNILIIRSKRFQTVPSYRLETMLSKQSFCRYDKTKLSIQSIVKNQTFLNVLYDSIFQQRGGGAVHSPINTFLIGNLASTSFPYGEDFRQSFRSGAFLYHIEIYS